MKIVVLSTLLAVVIGVLLGVGIKTFDYAEGLSYLSTDPAACANCHIMQSQYDSWQKASHHTVANCVDCHLPSAFIPKYIAKLENGWHHSTAFTMQNFVEPIVMSQKNAAILQSNCLRCHQDLVHDQLTAAPGNSQLRCISCHNSVGHGQVAGLGGPMTTDDKTEMHRK